MKRLSEKGFTLIEMATVLVIIALLALVVIVVYSGVQQGARDATRTQDIASLQKGLELYFSKNGQYPTSIGPTGSSNAWELSHNVLSGRRFMQNIVPIMSSAPVDPTNNASYNYQYISFNSGYTFPDGCKISQPLYVIRVVFEKPNTTIPSGPAIKCNASTTTFTSSPTLKFIVPGNVKKL